MDDNLSTLFETADQAVTIDDEDPFGDNNSIERMMHSLQITLIKSIVSTTRNKNVADVLDTLLEKIRDKCTTKEDLTKLTLLCNEFSKALVEADGRSFKTDVHKDCYDTIKGCSVLANDRSKTAPSVTSNVVLTSRIAPLDYEIKNAKLHNYYDLKSFFDRVNDLFNWFDETNYSKYIAPYFPLIQSSGTGKTLLMHQMKKLVNKDFAKDKNLKDAATKLKMEMEDTYCFMFCVEGPKTEVHSALNEIPKENDDAQIYEYMNKQIVVEKNIKRIILFFDEAQSLLHKEAMQFRWIRRWLRIKRDDNKQIVAVFSGTASSLSNYYPDVTG